MKDLYKNNSYPKQNINPAHQEIRLISYIRNVFPSQYIPAAPILDKCCIHLCHKILDTILQETIKNIFVLCDLILLYSQSQLEERMHTNNW